MQIKDSLKVQALSVTTPEEPQGTTVAKWASIDSEFSSISAYVFIRREADLLLGLCSHLFQGTPTAYVLSLHGGGQVHDKPNSLEWTAFFLPALPGTLRLIKNSDN